MRNDVKQKVESCEQCLSRLPSQSTEPLLCDRAQYPMEKVATDLCEFENKTFIVMVDRFSGYPWVNLLKKTDTVSVCQVLLEWFCQVGFPRTVKTDGGPQFRGPFLEFCSKFHILHATSSPYNPRSNGLAEAAVKSMKGLLKKMDGKIEGEDFKLALQAWRNTPRPDGFSPAYGFLGRHMCTTLPDIRDPAPNVLPEFTLARQARTDSAVAAAGGTELPKLCVGDRVFFQDALSRAWSAGGRILRERSGGRSYDVETSGGVFRRNRRFLRLDSSPVSFTDDLPVPVVEGDVCVVPRRSARLATKKKVMFANTVTVYF